ncbi:hypothetical protein [Nonlabens ulvanivorans]|uniref:hypothetical protein n=1 Tax=Nonlabens ulvanivorans TaxID=906888 RepID=UPI0037C60910
MTSAQKLAIVSPAVGLMIYDTSLNAFQFYDGSAWNAVGGTIVSSDANDYTGWADYSDNLYTSASPFIIGNSSANTSPNRVTLPNNAASGQTAQTPIDIPTFYDASTQTITGRNGDGINIVIEFKARPNTTSESRITVSIDLGGAVGEIYTRDFVLSKGNNIEHFYLSSFNAYTLGTWEANGGTVKISATDSTDIYDIRYVITRTHRAR